MIPVAQSEANAAEHFLQVSAAKLRSDFLPRLEKALAVVPENLTWSNDGGSTNSVGNILLHMSGNLRQWVVAGVGGVRDERDREQEFAASGGMTKQELIALLSGTVSDACDVLAHVSMDDLLLRRSIQSYTVTGLEAVYHAVEHFSYHLGQVIHTAKRLSGKDLHLYPF